MPDRRLLIVTTTFPRWSDDPGPAPFVFHHARALARHFEVTVLAPHHAGAAREEEMEGVRVRRFRYAWPERAELLCDGAGIQNNMRKSWAHGALVPALLLSEWIALRQALYRERFDYLNSHWLIPSGLLAALAAPSALPHIITVHAADYDLLLRLPWGRTVIRFLAERARALVCVSPRLAEGISQIAAGRGRLVVQPMGVDTRQFAFAEAARQQWREKVGVEQEAVLLFVGKLAPKKGVEVLLAAGAQLKRRGRRFRLVIAGEGEEREKLERRAESLSLRESVLFLGGLPNREAARLYSAADVVVVPSVRARGETEGMPVVIIEGLAAGRPVVATRVCSAPRELIDRGVVEVEENSAEALVWGIEKILAGRMTVEQELVKSYDLAAVAARYAELFAGVWR